MKKIVFEINNQEISLKVDEKEAGKIQLGGEEIMYVEIEEEYRGQGFYKMLLAAALKLSGKQVLYSFKRNEYSNPAYCKWTGVEDLDENQNVCIGLDNTGEGIATVIV